MITIPSHQPWLSKVSVEKRMGASEADDLAVLSRSLSKIRLIYCGCAGFGQIFRSFSLNRTHDSPQTIETSDSNQHTLATIANLGQAPSKSGGYYVEMVRTEGHRFLNIFSLADGG